MTETAILSFSSTKLNDQDTIIQIDDYVRSKKLAKQLQHVDVMEDYLKKVN